MPTRRGVVAEPRGLPKRSAAAYLGVSITSLEKLVADGRLRPIRYPGIRKDFFDRRALDLLIEQSEAVTVPATVPAKTSKYGFLQVARGGKRLASR
jgi:hypothetical protein